MNDYMPKFYTLEDMTQEDLNKLALERNNFAKEIQRLKTELQDTKEHLGEFLHEQEEENKRLNRKIKSIVYQCYGSDMSYGEFKQIWVNAMGKTYEPSQIDELEKELGVIKNEKD